MRVQNLVRELGRGRGGGGLTRSGSSSLISGLGTRERGRLDNHDLLLNLEVTGLLESSTAAGSGGEKESVSGVFVVVFPLPPSVVSPPC